jgi:DNA-binding beta-propeller fold protein YncE
LQTIVARRRRSVQMDRRAVLGGACAALLLGAACASAHGGDIRVARAGRGPAPRPGHAWTLTLTVRPESFHGVVRVTADGPVRLSARATGGNGRYRARLVFPRSGSWRLAATAGGTRSRLGSVRVPAPAPLVLEEPTGIDVLPDGSLLVVEFDRRRLLRVVPSTGRVTQVATFGKPWGVTRGEAGAVFVSSQNTVQRIDPGRAAVTVAVVDPSLEIGPVAVTPSGDLVYATASALYRLPGGIAGTPQPIAAGTVLAGPHGIAVTSGGVLLVSDTGNNRILRVEGDTVTTFATLGGPRGIDVAPDGTVYIASGDERRIFHYSASGDRLGVVGPRFADAYALSVAADGTVYAVDLGGLGIIRRIAPDGTASVVAAG